MKRDEKKLQAYLQKLNIAEMNPMQERMMEEFGEANGIVLLSPTGSGKTLSFLLPIIAAMPADIPGIKALILAPSRELAQQIEQVCRQLGTGLKTNVVYGGRSGYQDKIDLKSIPDILIGTPGRIADHIRKETFAVDNIQFVILDEFDKALEIGFEKEMEQIMGNIPDIQKLVLTSATNAFDMPVYIDMKEVTTLDFLDQNIPEIEIRSFNGDAKNRLESLVLLLKRMTGQTGIVFCNFKETIDEVGYCLAENQISFCTFHGNMEQLEREKALVKFRNQSVPLLLATDLAARGIDVPEIGFVVHFQLPQSLKEFKHRNGRTARMKRSGCAYVITEDRDKVPEYFKQLNVLETDLDQLPSTIAGISNDWTTLYITAGRRDKISKGDVVGFLIKQGQVDGDQIGKIEIRPTCTYVAVNKSVAKKVIQHTHNGRLKKKKVRVSKV